MHKKGFTLVELLVTISIFAILTGVVLFSQARFNGTILLTNLAYDTALTIRQAQTYGVNIKNFDIEGNFNFVPYGVHFETGAKSFILFADINKNGAFDGDSDSCLVPYIEGDGCVSRYNIQRGSFISKLCRELGGSGNEQCDGNFADVVFKRPNPEALLLVSVDQGNGSGTPPTSTLRIELSSSDGGSTRNVVVQSNGLIYVDNN